MKIIEKDILTVEKGIICHQVNCQKTMGSGIAKQIREKWPLVYDRYIEFDNILGNLQLEEVSTDLFVANLFGQNNYGYDGKRYTSYGAWERALPLLKKCSTELILPVYFPYKVGCDRGGGDFRIIEAMIEEYFPDAIFCKLPAKQNCAVHSFVTPDKCGCGKR
jgi:hypothetical protein